MTIVATGSGTPATLEGVSGLLIRFSEAVDGRHPALIAEQFTEEGLFQPGTPLMRGPAAIEAFYRSRQADPRRTTRHLWSNLRVEAQGADEAGFRAILSVYAFEPQISETALQVRIGTVSGRCARTGDVWLFAEHLYERAFTASWPLAGAQP